MLSLMASASSLLQLGLLCIRPLQYWLKPQVPPHAWRNRCLCVKVSQACVAALAPWKNHQWMKWRVSLVMVCRRKVVSTDASNLGWGGAVLRQTGLRPLVEEGRLPSHQLPGNTGRMFGPSHLSARPEGTSRLNPLGQYDGGVLHKSPGWSFLEVPLYSSRAPLEVGSAHLALAESNECARQTEPVSRHAISEQCPLRRVDAPPTNGSGNMGNLRQARGRSLRLRRQHSLPKRIFRRTGMRCPTTSPTSSFMLSPRSPWSHR